MTPDVNVLLAASRCDHPYHAVAYNWLEQAVAAASHGSPMRLQPMVVASFLRLATHPKIFVQPTPVEAALRFIDTLLAAPGVDRPLLGAEWPILKKLCVDRSFAANDIPDAWLAAIVIQQGEHLVSFDAVYKRFLARNQFTHLKP
ncbi:MAG: type II toxin-antitoxin system VapC family toxin [Candidatus Competibacteraceae bacterium]|nr:type II toxin-antitoxin system VapC family toxin [Candidatus Competibacteraceae bacterium]